MIGKAIFFFFSCVLNVLVSFSAFAQSEEKNLCAVAEVNVAACNTTKGKYVSICSSKDDGQAYYRFGSISKVELEVEFSEVRPIFRWVDLNTYITFFGFDNSGYSYVFGVPQETFGATAFLILKKTSDEFSFNDTFTCVSNSFGRKGLESSAIKDVENDIVRGSGQVKFPPVNK